MAEQWIPLRIDLGLFENLDEEAVLGYHAAIENGFVNEMGGHTRFPGLIEFVDLGGNARVYLHDLNDDLIAATAKGQIFRIDRAGSVENLTGVPISGGRRVIFARTDTELMMAAGGPIVRLRNLKSELLSSAAPLATHVGWIDGYTLATEINSGRVYYSAVNDPSSWDPLDTMAANGNPDNITNMIITPFREIMLGGSDSMEQFEILSNSDVPFFRRWSVGDGSIIPYALIFADNAVWTINNLIEFIRFTGQTSVSSSLEIGRLLEKVDNWDEAWIGGYPDRPLNTLGQKFILLQIPNATNSYGTKGITLLYDYRKKKWSSLYGWDDLNGTPIRWPGWSHWPLWGRIFVGGEGKIYELKDTTYRNAGATQRWLIRTAYTTAGAQAIIKNFRLRLKRGIGSNTVEPTIGVRCSRDGKAFGPWIRRGLGLTGDRVPYIEFGPFGGAYTFQWEISSSDDAAIDLVAAEVKVEPLGQ